MSSGTQHQKNRTIVYTSGDLRKIRNNVCCGWQYRKLPGQMVKTIRNLRLNKKKRGSRAGRSKTLDQHRTVNMGNLIRINSDRIIRDGENQKTNSWWIDFNNLINIYIENRPKMDIANDLSLMLVNVESIKSKTELVMDYLLDNKVDIAILTETWLSDNVEIWLKASDLNQHGCRTLHQNRPKHQGGGLAIICKFHLQVKQLDTGSKSSFEYLVCRISGKTLVVTNVAIYHPPYSATNNSTNAKFIDEFTEYLVDSIMTYNNIVILGDFNLHINDQEDPDTNIFIDTITALGLDQYVDFVTNNKVNILDLIMTEPLCKIKVTSCTPELFFTDHCAVNFTISVTKQNMERKEITFHHI